MPMASVFPLLPTGIDGENIVLHTADLMPSAPIRRSADAVLPSAKCSVSGGGDLPALLSEEVVEYVKDVSRDDTCTVHKGGFGRADCRAWRRVERWMRIVRTVGIKIE